MGIRRIKNYMCHIYMRVYSLFHPVSKSIFFHGLHGDTYSDNSRAISEKMHELYPEYNLIWYLPGFEDKYGIVPDYVKVVTEKFVHLNVIATSFCYVSSEDIDMKIWKRKKQLYIQMWHGDRVPKKVLYDDIPKEKWEIPIADEFYTDLAVAASDIGERVYRTAFNFRGEIIKVGMPRNDKLIIDSDEERRIIYGRLGIDGSKKYLLYAPTYRDNLSDKQAVLLDIDRTLDLLEKGGDEWVCLLRSHHSSKGLKYEKTNNRIVDVSDYSDMADILLISDALITDYSSCSGDMILRDKLVIMAMFDKKEYEEKYRKLAFDPVEVGFFVAFNQNELDELIINMNEERIINNCKYLREYFNICETGRSSEIICKKINSFYRENYC